MQWSNRYHVKSFFPSDGMWRRECRRVLGRTRLDQESGNYMQPLYEARCRRAQAHVEEIYIRRLEALDEECLQRKSRILKMQKALEQLETELYEGEWDDEF